ncbi:hypothetical protein FHR32_002115 [Streptosporangium album]|uniref:Uncharacterized protein n=1 Tax=Streptosporangium album TaxID=47479 RepID=A0A7W7RTE0_9ACTN|nr:hypothetical protein [Streptosporangium album]MBB4937810.1 hypothetical protein [Streptosporangium album]
MTVPEAAAAARAWLEQVADRLAYGTPSGPAPAQVRDARASIDPPAEVVEFVPPTLVRQVRPRLTLEAILVDGRIVTVVREATDEQMARHR